MIKSELAYRIIISYDCAFTHKGSEAGHNTLVYSWEGKEAAENKYRFLKERPSVSNLSLEVVTVIEKITPEDE
ncbi:hypothetical protein CPT_Moonbeam13 [Bacillus phage Moonbeam]|uniref:Uncharacterized protein n=1 Tax=Bacillus phage Moonbeam TaxID=1540091 RepID=A0A0A0RSC7_9CAUD|nr:hypothetical protein CPT_Moonbeam13 [Bacillus phage Moonbeam]AIW03411.1 hypothetical protein CPT_Moonbeam13 [Bacillus phage Moonbeam]